jgi:hypothetical protein
VSRVIDLDQLRAEANTEPIEVRVGGATFTLPAVMPVALSLKMDALAQADITPAAAAAIFETMVEGLVGDRAGELLAVVSLTELQHLMVAAYGMPVGESSALAASSPNGGTPPRPTAPATTTPTSLDGASPTARG